MDKKELIPLEQVLLDMKSDNDIIANSAKDYYELNYKNISKLIYQNLDREYDISEFLIDCGIMKEYFMESIEEVLIDIL